jgi:hypothetical protein
VAVQQVGKTGRGAGREMGEGSGRDSDEAFGKLPLRESRLADAGYGALRREGGGAVAK